VRQRLAQHYGYYYISMHNNTANHNSMHNNTATLLPKMPHMYRICVMYGLHINFSFLNVFS
jgi:hypothetical protein